jgi:hypothetical protein
MKTYPLSAPQFAAFLVSTMVFSFAQADVTIQEKTNLEVASMIRMHGALTLSITADKKREDSESHCEGALSLFCGNVQGGEIVRLDRDLVWRLEPKKKLYIEQPFASPAEIAAMRAKMQANLEKMSSCPVSPKQQPIDKSQCQMSPPKIDVHRTGDTLSIAGHDAERTAATLTETCTNKDTGNACDTVIAVDIWLTQDELPGRSERRTFNQAYAKKLGIADSAGVMRYDIAKYLAAYQSQIKQLQDKFGDLKGQPLKTSLRVLVGGPQCASTANMKSDTATDSSSGAGPNNAITGVTQAGKAVGSLVSGLFHKKKADDSTVPPAAANAAGGSAADPFAQLVQMAAFTMETMAISADTIPAERFDIPSGWTKETPKPSKSGDDDVACPKTGS